MGSNHSPAMSEKLCLKWKDFQENVNSAFGSLREDNELVDVSLACEDGQQVEAHKFVLAASSPFFQNLLRRNKHPHPLIYMRGVRSEDLVAIVDFLYDGEANVYQENIDGFLALAEELKLKGLVGNNEDTKNESIEEPKQEHILKDSKGMVPNEKQKVPESEMVSEKEETQVSYGAIIATNQIFCGDVQALDEQINTMMTKNKNILKCGRNSERARVCTVCGKEGFATTIKNHIEANHIEGVSIPCNDCEKTFRTRNAQRQHKTTSTRGCQVNRK